MIYVSRLALSAGQSAEELSLKQLMPALPGVFFPSAILVVLQKYAYLIPCHFTAYAWTKIFYVPLMGELPGIQYE